MKKINKLKLSDLPGKPKSVLAAWISNPDQVESALKSHGAVTSSCDNGALSVWKHTDGTYTGEAHCHRLTVRSVSHVDFDAAVKFAKNWLNGEIAGSPLNVVRSETDAQTDPAKGQ